MDLRVRVSLAVALVAAYPLVSLGQPAAPVASPAPSGSPSATAPIARTSVSFLFHPPLGWRRATLPPLNTFSIADGTKVHVLGFVSPRTSATDLDGFVAETMADERKRGADIVDEGPTTVCDGMPAHRWTMHNANTGTAMVTHFLSAAVTGGFATAMYTHAVDVGDRKDGLDAMATLCPGPVANPVPVGWAGRPKTRFPTAPSLSETLESPDDTSTFVAQFRMITENYFAGFERDAIPQGVVVSDQHEPCGTGNVHVVDVRVDQQIVEVAVAYLHDVAYKYVYTRPATHDPDAGAERALTAFCRALGPVGPGSSPI